MRALGGLTVPRQRLLAGRLPVNVRPVRPYRPLTSGGTHPGIVEALATKGARMDEDDRQDSAGKTFLGTGNAAGDDSGRVQGPVNAVGSVRTTGPVRRRPSRRLMERLEGWAWAHSRGLKVAAGIYFAVLVVSIVAVSYVAFGLPALVINLVAGVIAGPFFLLLCAIMAAVGIMVIVSGESIGLRLFCVVETIVVAWLTVTFVFGSIGRAGNALLDLWSQPVQAQATYLSYQEDDEGPDTIGVSVTVGDEESYESWPSEVADKLADYGVSEGDDFRVWVYPHTHIPLDVVNPAEYS